MTTLDDKITIGVDLGDRYSLAYVVDAAGEEVGTARVPTTPAALAQWFRGAATRSSGPRSGHPFPVGEPLARDARTRGDRREPPEAAVDLRERPQR